MGIISNNKKGFTIVELLIVVVVIAILAAITIVAYNGITAKTRQSVMQNDLQQASKLIENYKTINGAYPASLGLLNGGQGVTASNGNQYAYTVSGSDYQLSIVSSSSSDQYRISNTTGNVETGIWPGHDVLVSGFPTRDGYIDITSIYGSVSDTNEANISSVPVGGWMMVVLSYTNAADLTPPAGWTALVTRKTTNTMQTSIYAKIKQAGDADEQLFDASGTNGAQLTNAVLLWGRNAANVGSWTVGSFGDRINNATPTTTVTPTMNVTTAKSLVLSIATERTSAAETNYVSLVGVTPWIWIPQPAAYPSKMQTITIGYDEQATPGTSKAMTVTYPNDMNTNGTGVQVAIPPAS